MDWFEKWAISWTRKTVGSAFLFYLTIVGVVAFVIIDHVLPMKNMEGVHMGTIIMAVILIMSISAMRGAYLSNKHR